MLFIKKWNDRKRDVELIVADSYDIAVSMALNDSAAAGNITTVTDGDGNILINGKHIHTEEELIKELGYRIIDGNKTYSLEQHRVI